MRICLIGKFPPIQGGVSMRTYWAAHALAARGHEVHVVTNAKEVQPPFRMHMREQDWQRCEATYGGGAVTVYWTDPVDRSQAYIPMASPFVSKLAGIALRLHAEHPFDVIHSFYLEPYGVAGHLVAQMTGVPHVTRTAGSDAGRLWRHPQLEPLYDQVFQSAAGVIAGKAAASRAVQRGVDADRIAFAGGVVVPEGVFTPVGPSLDLAALRAEVAFDPDLSNLLWGEFAGDRPYFGVYGKLGESKGSFSLLAALRRIRDAGLNVGLVALAHGPPAVEERFRAHARDFGLADRILQLPFLPHWRVPEFIRGCLAVCCLEQDFPIRFHSPIIPREVLLCGTCLVASTEVIRKLPGHSQLPHGFGCIAVEDVNDGGALSKQLAAIVEDPAPALDVGARGREFARLLQRNVAFPQELEGTLAAAAAGRRVGPAAARPSGDAANQAGNGFWLCQLAAAAVERADLDAETPPRQAIVQARDPDLAWARGLLAAIEERIAGGDRSLNGLIPAVRVEIAVAAAEDDADATGSGGEGDPLFRLRITRWAMAKNDLPGLVCVRDPRLRVLTFEFDVTGLMSIRSADDLAAPPAPRQSYLVAFGCGDGGRRSPLVVDRAAARILELSDATRSASEIVSELNQEGELLGDGVGFQWIESLFAHGLLSLRDRRLDAAHDTGLVKDDQGISLECEAVDATS